MKQRPTPPAELTENNNPIRDVTVVDAGCYLECLDYPACQCGRRDRETIESAG